MGWRWTNDDWEYLRHTMLLNDTTCSDWCVLSYGVCVYLDAAWRCVCWCCWCCWCVEDADIFRCSIPWPLRSYTMIPHEGLVTDLCSINRHLRNRVQFNMADRQPGVDRAWRLCTRICTTSSDLLVTNRNSM
jgi:hypothetical protein